MRDYAVIGCFLSIGPEGRAEEADARATAQALGIPFQTVDIAAALEEQVKAPFAAEYRAGRTPLPCARCNPLVKFPALLTAAEAVGASAVATGHYARVRHADDGRALLWKGCEKNDQSYMLAQLPQSILKHVMFPLGAYEKGTVRGLAKTFGLPVAEKRDSMEICFIPGHDYAAWLERRGAAGPPGDFLTPDGTYLARHQGIHHYTLGQGRGLGVSGPHRYYVSGIDPAANTVTLSDGADLYRNVVFCEGLNWIAFDALTGPLEAQVRFRHTRNQTVCTIFPTETGVRVEAHTPVRAPAPGQLAVFYQEDAVLGSGWIASSTICT